MTVAWGDPVRQLFFNKSDRVVYVGSHPSEGTGGGTDTWLFQYRAYNTDAEEYRKMCLVRRQTRLHSSYLIKSYALYAECGNIRVLNGGFGGMVKSFSLSGSSATIDCNFLTGAVNGAQAGMLDAGKNSTGIRRGNGWRC